ncbi:MAG: FAD-binding oxidoreductase [Acidimicrobiales bacterium]
MSTLHPTPGAPTPPIAIAGDGAATARLPTRTVDLEDAFVAELGRACADITIDLRDRAEASRDWWPLAMVWATEGQVGAIAGAVARPSTAAEVSAVLATCNAAGVPVTAAGGRSSVVGGTVPVYGGVVLDLCALSGIVAVDPISMIVEVLPGTFGDALEAELGATYGLTVGHWPQSMALSTVGGWLACRGAGQYSNRYGKIEDIVVGLEVVLADGRTIRTGGQPRQAVGPDLNQVFVGSEGTLGVITRAWLQAHRQPTHERRCAYGFGSFAEGLDTMRRITQRGATPAVMRLYDEIESQRNHQTADGVNVLLVLDQGDGTIIEAGMEVVAEECMTAQRLDPSLVDHWMEKRNDVDALEALIGKGFVVDTMEVAGQWSALPSIFEAATAAIGAVEGTLAVSAHQSHSYQTGGCLYFTFAGRVEADQRDGYYTAAWDAGTRAVLGLGGALSHHHGVGLSRARFVAEALGSAFETLVTVKQALDPAGILNPGKLGLPSPFGADPFGAGPTP